MFLLHRVFDVLNNDMCSINVISSVHKLKARLNFLLSAFPLFPSNHGLLYMAQTVRLCLFLHEMTLIVHKSFESLF